MKRVKNENSNIQKKCCLDKFLVHSMKNMKEFKGFIKGPENSFYSGYIFEIVIRIQDEYPFKPPNVYFLTKIFHPNIHPVSGEVCLDIIKNSWKPVFNLVVLLDCLRDLLAHPNADSPLNCDAGNPSFSFLVSPSLFIFNLLLSRSKPTNSKEFY
jgi:peroxin-4